MTSSVTTVTLGEPDAGKLARPVRREARGDLLPQGNKAPRAYSTSVMDHLDHLRIELIQIATGERWHQTERPPQMDDLARDLGELAALLQVRQLLARNENVK